MRKCANLSRYTLTDTVGTEALRREINAFNNIGAGTFTTPYPVDYSFTEQQQSSLPVHIRLSSPGLGRSHFDEVILVSEPQ